jgi:hypothetical protein
MADLESPPPPLSKMRSMKSKAALLRSVARERQLSITFSIASASVPLLDTPGEGQAASEDATAAAAAEPSGRKGPKVKKVLYDVAGAADAGAGR